MMDLEEYGFNDINLVSLTTPSVTDTVSCRLKLHHQILERCELGSVARVFHVSLGTPFLYNVASVLSSASSSSSSLPSENIADLRSARKLETLEDAKKPSDEDETFVNVDISDDDEANEASPSLLQKKIGKILRKIQFLTMFANGGDRDKTDDDFDREQAEFDKKFEEDAANKTTGEITNKASVITTKTSQIVSKTSSEIVGEVTNKTELSDLAREASDQTNEASDHEDEASDHEDEASDHADEASAQQGYLYKRPRPLKIVENRIGVEQQASAPIKNMTGLGVFFSELLGTFLGLAYGAAAQLNHLRPSTTATTEAT